MLVLKARKNSVPIDLLVIQKGKKYPIGTIREWKGQKYIKTPKGDWKPHGKKMSKEKQAKDIVKEYIYDDISFEVARYHLEKLGYDKMTANKKLLLAPKKVRPTSSKDNVNQKKEVIDKNAASEMQKIKAMYHNEDGTPKEGWLKAPNGKDTNLTEKQWLQVRTPQFKNWFGDWEAAAHIETIKNIEAKKDVIKASINQKEAEDLVRKFGQIKNNKDGRIAEIPVNTVGKIYRHKGFDISKIIESLPELYETSLLGWTEKENDKKGHKKHRNIKAYHQYINKFSDETTEYFIRFTVNEANVKPGKTGKNIIHSTAISDIEIYKKGENSGRVRGIDPGVKNSSPFHDNKLAEFFNSVKGNVSKIVDENGEPRVVYHGTNTEFDTFDNEKLASNSSWKTSYFGHYFSSKGGNYGKISMPVFLNIRKPHIAEVEYYSDFDYDYKNFDPRNFKKNDGIVIKTQKLGGGEIADTHYVAFNPNQIKSAINNEGNFDPKNNSINKSQNKEKPMRLLMKKAKTDDKLEYFRKKILDHLTGLEADEEKETKAMNKAMAKARGYSVGTIREWKGKKYVKNPDGKWRPKYDEHSRGAKLSIAALKKKVTAAKDVSELLGIITANKKRFKDANGKYYPFVYELARYVKEQKEGKTKKQSGISLKKEKTEGFDKEKIGKVDKWLVDAEKQIGINIDGFEHEVTSHFVNHVIKNHGDDKKEKARGQIAIKPDDFNKIPDIIKNPDSVVIGGKYKKGENKGNNFIGYVKKVNGTALYFEVVMDSKKNKTLRSKTMYKLKKEDAEEDRLYNTMANNSDEYDISNAKIISLAATGGNPGLVPTTKESALSATLNQTEGSSTSNITQNNEKSSPEPEKSEAEKHQNRSEAMEGNDNAAGSRGGKTPETKKEIQAAQDEEVKARRKAKMPDAEQPASATKDSTWNPKSEDYRFKDTGYIAGSKKELARLRQAIKDGEQLLNTDIDWESIEENERVAEDIITKQNLMGKPDWEALKESGMKGSAGFLINQLYKTIVSKPEKNTPETRQLFSRALDTIRSRCEECKTVDELKALAEEIEGEIDGVFIQSRQTDEYIALAEKKEKLKGKIKKIKEAIGKKIKNGNNPYQEAIDYMRKVGIGYIEQYFDLETGDWDNSYPRSIGNRGLEMLRSGRRKYEEMANEIGMKEINEEIGNIIRKMYEVENKTNDELKLTNTMSEAWKTLGDSFKYAVKNIKRMGTRYYSGTKTFLKHIEAAGKIADDDFSWAEKKPVTGGKKERKTKFELKVVDNITRKGGRSIKTESTEELKKAFVLRDVQLGEYVAKDPKSAKFHVEQIAAGLADLADVTGISDNLVSLNGRLAMAIGARGGGKALAHYETKERVINITKMRGGGSLGHEWFHAFDNLIAEAMTGGKYNIFLTADNDTENIGNSREISVIIDQLKRIKGALATYPKGSQNYEYYKERYETFTKEAEKLGINPETLEVEGDHIEQVKKAFSNLVNTMMSGNANKTKLITYKSEDVELAKKAFETEKQYGRAKVTAEKIVNMKNDGKSIEEIIEATKDNYQGAFVNGKFLSGDKLNKFIIAYCDNNPEGGEYKIQTNAKVSKFFNDAVELDGGKENGYWQNIKEMGARAFSAYLEDRLAEKEQENTYLTRATNADYNGYVPYPEGDERKAINAAFDELFKVINATGAIRKALEIGEEFDMKLFMKKAKTDDKLEYFRKKILDHLTGLEAEEEKETKAMNKAMAKARGYTVGTIREWKGKKYIKAPDGKWKPKYDSHSRGAKMAVAAIKREIAAAKTAEDMMQIVLKHRDRFSDKDGNPLPFVQELSAYVNEQQEQKQPKEKPKKEEKKPKAEKKDKTEESQKTEKEPEKGEWEKLNDIREKREKETVKKEKPADDGFSKIQQKYQSAKAIEGEEDEIIVGKETITGKWKLVEADTPTASHDETNFTKTEGFPTNEDGSTINDRDYEQDNAAQEAVLEIASDYDGQALSMDSPVIVSKDGVVVSGNNRTMSSKLAAKKGTDKKYIETLKKKAKKFGFTSEQIGEFKNPRVIFEADSIDGYSTKQFAKFNESDKKAMNPIESAVKVSKIMKSETVESIAGKIGEFETLGELYANKKAVNEIFNTLQRDGIIGQFDRPQYATEDGITGAGKEFLETVLIGSVINEKNIRSLNREGCKSIRQKLVRAITPLIENKGMKGYSIVNELNDAVRITMEVATNKDKFNSVIEYAQQQNMFEKLDPVAVELAKKLDGTQKEFAEFMQTMNGGLKVAANGEADIFLGEVESKEAILSRILNLKAIKKAVDRAFFLFRKKKGLQSIENML